MQRPFVAAAWGRRSPKTQSARKGLWLAAMATPWVAVCPKPSRPVRALWCCDRRPPPITRQRRHASDGNGLSTNRQRRRCDAGHKKPVPTLCGLKPLANGLYREAIGHGFQKALHSGFYKGKTVKTRVSTVYEHEQMQNKISLGTDAVFHKTDGIKQMKIPLNPYAFQ
jgi:hypothetical protein